MVERQNSSNPDRINKSKPFFRTIKDEFGLRIFSVRVIQYSHILGTGQVTPIFPDCYVGAVKNPLEATDYFKNVEGNR